MQTFEPAREEQNDHEHHPLADRYHVHDASFRQHYHRNYADRGHSYETFYAPAYRFGYELARESGGTAWEDLLVVAQAHWANHYISPWNEVADAVRYGWTEQRNPDSERVSHT